MFRWEHISIKRSFTSLPLLFNLSLLGVSSEIEILFLSDFSEVARSIISLAIWLDVQSEFKSRTVGFTWSCMHLTLAKLNGQTLTRQLWFSFRFSKKPFNFFYHAVSKYENSFFWGWRRRSAINFTIITTSSATIAFIINTIIIVLVSIIIF